MDGVKIKWHYIQYKINFMIHYKKVLKGHRDDCGKPGINGGYFKDKDLKFGVNCLWS